MEDTRRRGFVHRVRLALSLWLRLSPLSDADTPLSGPPRPRTMYVVAWACVPFVLLAFVLRMAEPLTQWLMCAVVLPVLLLAWASRLAGVPVPRLEDARLPEDGGQEALEDARRVRSLLSWSKAELVRTLGRRLAFKFVRGSYAISARGDCASARLADLAGLAKLAEEWREDRDGPGAWRGRQQGGPVMHRAVRDAGQG